MNKYNKVVIVVMIVLTVFGWQQYLATQTSKRVEYNKNINMGNEKLSKELYQEAFKYYENAYAVIPTETAIKKEIEAYAKYYEKEKSYELYSNFKGILATACKRIPKEKSIWEKRLELALENEEYDEAQSVYKKIVDSGLKSKKITELKKALTYVYETSSSSFTKYKENTNGTYATCLGTEWRVINEIGENVSGNNKYLDMGQVNKENIFLCMRDNTEINFMDTDGIVKGIVKEKVTNCGMYNCRLCPVTINNEYYYIDIDGNKKLGPYLFAGTFEKNKAAVQDKDGKWGIINIKGEYIVQPKYEDIKLTESGGYTLSEKVIAKENGKYNIYNENLNKIIVNIDADNMGILTKDGIVSYEKEDKWGYVSLKGKIIITPQYYGAKSFSNGFAAVQVKENFWKIISKDNEFILDEEFYDAGYMNKSGGLIVSKRAGLYELLVFKYPEMFE